jgi:hypothetical protein
VDLDSDKKKFNIMFAVGGGYSLVQLVEIFCKKAVRKFPDPSQVMEVDKVELYILEKSLDVITELTYHIHECGSAMSAVGGVEAVIAVMKTFPKCQALHESACYVLVNLTWSCNIGTDNAVASVGFEVLLDAVNYHLDSAVVCEKAFGVIESVISESKENTKLFMNAGGVAALTEVRTKWPNNDEIQHVVRILAKLIAAQMNTS